MQLQKGKYFELTMKIKHVNHSRVLTLLLSRVNSESCILVDKYFIEYCIKGIRELSGVELGERAIRSSVKSLKDLGILIKRMKDVYYINPDVYSFTAENSEAYTNLELDIKKMTALNSRGK